MHWALELAAQHVAVVPEFLDDGGAIHRSSFFCWLRRFLRVKYEA
jgi:hypothetical protein